MSAVRRHLRVCVAIWALGQSVLLTALLPRDCCAVHPSSAHSRSSVETRSGSANGDHCAVTDQAVAPAGPSSKCTLRAECNGPLAALASLLSAQGVTPDVLSLPADQQVQGQILPVADPLLASTILPDTPPPRL